MEIPLTVFLFVFAQSILIIYVRYVNIVSYNLQLPFDRYNIQ